MSVQMQPTPLSVIEHAARAKQQVPGLWTQLGPHQQMHLAQCWARLIHQIRQPPVAGREVGHDAVQ